LSLDRQIKNQEIESKVLNFENFNTKLETFEKSFNNSKFSKFRPINYKFEILKNQRSSIIKQIEKKMTNKFHKMSTSFDDKIEKFEKRLKF